jgi:hypothetical protein
VHRAKALVPSPEWRYGGGSREVAACGTLVGMELIDLLWGASLGAVVGGVAGRYLAYRRRLEAAGRCQRCGAHVERRPFCDDCLPEVTQWDWAA